MLLNSNTARQEIRSASKLLRKNDSWSRVVFPVTCQGRWIKTLPNVKVGTCASPGPSLRSYKQQKWPAARGDLWAKSREPELEGKRGPQGEDTGALNETVPVWVQVGKGRATLQRGTNGMSDAFEHNQGKLRGQSYFPSICSQATTKREN